MTISSILLLAATGAFAYRPLPPPAIEIDTSGIEPRTAAEATRTALTLA